MLILEPLGTAYVFQGVGVPVPDSCLIILTWYDAIELIYGGLAVILKDVN